MPPQKTVRFGVMIGLLCLLPACESSRRLDSFIPGGGQNAQATPPPLTAAPSSEVDTSALPPPSGAQTTPLPGQMGAYPQQPGSVTTAPGNFPTNQGQQQGQMAALPSPMVAPTRTSVTGNWGLIEATGTRCRLTLSSAPKLDLYAAGTSGCQSKELQRINAWELNGSEVILYEPGGQVAARLRQSGSGFSGVAAKTGAPITIAK